jgi:hypothetical protein
VPAGSERNGRSAIVLRADDGFTLPKIQGKQLDQRVFTATFYDTPQRRLARAGITLCRRMENGNNVWELELPREPESRTIDAPGGPAGPPPLLARLLNGVLQRGQLEEVQTIRTRRTGLRAGDGKVETVEVIVDSNSVLDGRRVERTFTEISLRPLDSDTRAMRARRQPGGRPPASRRDPPCAGDAAGGAFVLHRRPA